MKSPTLMSQTRVATAEVIIRDRLRPVGEAGVASLLASIAEVGVMKDAIHLRKKKDGKLYLIAGGHRLDAAKRLAWPEIEAKVWDNVDLLDKQFDKDHFVQVRGKASVYMNKMQIVVAEITKILEEQADQWAFLLKNLAS